MSRVLAVLLVGSVAVFGLCSGDAQSRALLEDKIKKTKEETENVNKDNARVSKDIDEISKSCWKKIKAGNDLVSKGKAINKEQQRIIEDLYEKLLKTHTEKDKLLEIPQEIKSIKLGVRVLVENIELLERRRVNGIAKTCLYMEGMAVMHNGSQPSTLARGGVRDTIALENELRLAQSDLTDAKFLNQELKMKLKAKMDGCAKKIENIREMLRTVEDNTEKADESIAQLKKEIAEHQRRVDELSKDAGVTKEELEKWKMEAKKLLAKYVNYAPDIKCYEKLLRELTLLVSPIHQ